MFPASSQTIEKPRNVKGLTHPDEPNPLPPDAPWMADGTYDLTYSCEQTNGEEYL
jgi:hypothetical protein